MVLVSVFLPEYKNLRSIRRESPYVEILGRNNGFLHKNLMNLGFLQE